MKNLAALCVLIITLFTVKTNISVTLNLTDIGTENQLFLKNGNKVDSAKIDRGRVSFLVPSTTEDPYTISIYSRDRKFNYVLFIENKDIKLNGSFLTPKALKCEGSNTQIEFLEYLSTVEPLRGSHTREMMNGQAQAADSIRRLITNFERKFTVKYPKSYISSRIPYFAFRDKSISAKEAIAWLKPMEVFQPKAVNKYIDDIKEFSVLKMVIWLRHSHLKIF